jgi:hypothetical protein
MAINAQELLEEIGQGLVETTVFALTVAAVSRNSSRNNLSGSRLAESFEYIILKDGGIQIIANYYWKFIEDGIPRGTAVPIAALIEWANRYRIRPKDGNFLGMIFAIQRAIINRGTLPRPFVEQAIIDADKLVFAQFDNLIEVTFFSD